MKISGAENGSPIFKYSMDRVLANYTAGEEGGSNREGIFSNAETQRRRVLFLLFFLSAKTRLNCQTLSFFKN
jgi:hypothetical protein